MKVRLAALLAFLAIVYGNGTPTLFGQVKYVLSDTDASSQLTGFESAKGDCSCDAKGKGAAAFGYGDGECRCFDDWCGPCRITTDIIFLNRGKSRDVQLVDNGAVGAAQQTVLSARDLDFEYETGMRIDLFHRTNDCVAWQVGYDGANWDTQRVLLAANQGRLRAQQNTQLGGNGSFDNADQVRTSYNSDYDTLEINRHHCWHGTNLIWLIGVRHISLDEDFRLASTRGANTGTYDIRTDNNIWGGQIGLDWMRMVHQRCCIGINGRFVVGGNSADQTVLLVDRGTAANVVERDFSNSGSRVSLLGELDFSLGLRIHECWCIRGGYQLLWLGGVALAPEQYQFDAQTPDAAIDTDGTAFLNGFFFGLEGTL